MTGTFGFASSRSGNWNKSLSADIAISLTPEQRRALKSLARAIELTTGRFSLIFMRSNSPELQERGLEVLVDQCKVVPQIVHVPISATSLFAELQAVTPSSAGVILLGLDNVSQLDELLISANQMRNQFPKRFAFPIALWINDATLRKLIRLAPDFYSWANTPIHFD